MRQWDDLIVCLMVSKLDVETKNKWNDVAPSTHLPTVDDLCIFLSSHSHKLDSQPTSVPIKSKPSKSNSRSSNQSSTNSHALTRSSKFHCVRCNTSGDTIVRCHKFLQTPIDLRHKFVTDAKLCYNCLSPNHVVSSCEVSHRCRHCNMPHIIHFFTS